MSGGASVDEAERRAKAYAEIGIQQRLFKDTHVREAEKARQPLPEYLLAHRLLTPDQHTGLERAVSYRLGRDEDKKVAHLVVEHGYCSEAAVAKALKQQKEFYAKTGQLIRLGNLLVETGSLTDSQHLAAMKLFRLSARS